MVFTFKAKILGLLTILLIVGACTPDTAVSATIPPTRTVVPTETGTAVAQAPSTTAPTLSPTPALTKTQMPTNTPSSTPTPGPPLAYWYSQNERIYRYNFQNWTDEIFQR